MPSILISAFICLPLFRYNVGDTSFRLFDTFYETIHSASTIYISATVRAEVHDQKEHRL